MSPGPYWARGPRAEPLGVGPRLLERDRLDRRHLLLERRDLQAERSEAAYAALLLARRAGLEQQVGLRDVAGPRQLGGLDRLGGQAVELGAHLGQRPVEV